LDKHLDDLKGTCQVIGEDYYPRDKVKMKTCTKQLYALAVIQLKRDGLIPLTDKEKKRKEEAAERKTKEEGEWIDYDFAR
jgi:hypothetical protein